MVNAEDDAWPEWPKDAKPQRIVDTQVACSADELFLLLWASKSAYVAMSQDVLGNRDYTESSWAPEAELFAGKGSGATEPLKPSNYKGLSRKSSCSSSGMGLKYVNTELQRCTEAAEGGPFEVDVVVHTTATYGDRFRPILKHRIVAAGATACIYTVDYAIVYIASTNSFLKKAIERGANNGVTKNFQILLEVLSSFKSVGGVAKSPSTASTNQEVGKRDLPQRLQPELPWWSPPISRAIVRVMETPATWILCKSRVLGSAADSSESSLHVASVLALLAVLLALMAVLSLFQKLQSSCHGAGLASRLCSMLISAVGPPMTLGQVLFGGFLLFLANAIVAAVAGRISDTFPPDCLASRSFPGSRRATSDGGDHPSSGIRYEGFEQSLEEASANIAHGEGELVKPSIAAVSSSRTINVSQRKGHQIKENLKTGLKSLMEPIKWPKKDDKQKAASSEVSKGQRKEDKQKSSSPPSQPSMVGASIPGAPSTACRAKDEEGGVPQRSAEASADSSSRQNLQTVGSDASSTNVFSDEDEKFSQTGSASKRSSGAGFRDLMNPGGFLDKTEHMFAHWSGSHKPAKSPALDIPGPLVLREEHGSASPAMELANLSPRDPEETSGPVEEEVFENERYQPFRGWGHLWPGHFLPTDRVGHWSTNGSFLSPHLNPASFDAIAPKLKEGWEWVDEGWQIDVRGLVENSVDDEGWTYAVDFPWIQWPPAPGTGKFRKVRDYVRRRRWFRTRVFAGAQREESPPPKRLPSTSAPSMTSLLTEALVRTSTEATDKTQNLPPKPRRSDYQRSISNTSASSVERSSSLSAPTAQSPQGKEKPAKSETKNAASRVEVTQAEKQHKILDMKSRIANLSGASTTADNTEQGEADGQEKGPSTSSWEESKKNFADKMSSMFKAASNGMRTKRDEENSSRVQTHKPVLVRGSAPGASASQPQDNQVRRSASEDLETSTRTQDLTMFFGIQLPGAEGCHGINSKEVNASQISDTDTDTAGSIKPPHVASFPSQPGRQSQTMPANLTVSAAPLPAGGESISSTEADASAPEQGKGHFAAESIGSTEQKTHCGLQKGGSQELSMSPNGQKPPLTVGSEDAGGGSPPLQQGVGQRLSTPEPKAAHSAPTEYNSEKAALLKEEVSAADSATAESLEGWSSREPVSTEQSPSTRGRSDEARQSSEGVDVALNDRLAASSQPGSSADSPVGVVNGVHADAMDGPQLRIAGSAVNPLGGSTSEAE